MVEGNATNNFSWKLNGMTASYSDGSITASGTLYDTYYIVQSGSTVSVSSINTAGSGVTVYNNATWYQKSGTTSITDIMAAAGDGASLITTVELSGGELTVDGDIATVNATGGMVNVESKEYKIGSLNVNEDTTVAGEVDSSVVGIASGKTASFTEGLQAQGVEYASAPIGGVQVTNNGTQTQT